MWIAPRRCLVFAALALVLAPAQAQIAPPRTLDELKAETQARADRNAYPLTGLKPADVRAALAKITSLDRDAWAAAWSSVAAGYEADAKAADAAGQGKEAQEASHRSNLWRITANSPVQGGPAKIRDALVPPNPKEFEST